MDSAKQSQSFMVKVMSDPRYRGKHVVVIAGKVFTAASGTKANKLLDKLERKYPEETPAITYISKSDIIMTFSSRYGPAFSEL